MKKYYCPLSMIPVPIQTEDSTLLVDSGKLAAPIAPIEAEVADFVFEDEKTHDFGEISFL